MKEGTIVVDPRHTYRSIIKATQGNVIRALVELITNSDDSYIRLEGNNNNFIGNIIIEYKKIGFCGHFSVCDYAEGMTEVEVEKNFTKYGAFTSGKEIGKSV